MKIKREDDYRAPTTKQPHSSKEDLTLSPEGLSLANRVEAVAQSLRKILEVGNKKGSF